LGRFKFREESDYRYIMRREQIIRSAITQI
jgi:hypothetical protein